MKGKADAGPISTSAKFFRDFVQHGLRIVQAEEDSRATRLQLTQEEDVIDQHPHLLDFSPPLFEERDRILAGKRGGLQQGQEARQRRPELVRDRGREPDPQLFVGRKVSGLPEVDERLLAAINLVRHEDRLVPLRPPRGSVLEGVGRRQGRRLRPALGGWQRGR